uniref:PadR family transcriptional regulator n=1 Tax=Ignisphaera aggregans TaxID=334771 RepID=A0A7J2U5I7_9CREN
MCRAGSPHINGHTYLHGHPCPSHGVPVRGLLSLAILSLIKRKAMHGAEVHRLLKEKFGIEVPKSIVYVLLRRLEHLGFVTSKWETEEGGPARRVYMITDEGIEYLEAVVEALRDTKKIIDIILAENEKK